MSPSVRKIQARGFTLVEVLAIVVILGLTAMITGPSLARSFAGDPVNETVQQLSQAWLQARMAALDVGGVLECTAGRMRFVATGGRAEEYPLDSRVQVTWRGTIPAGSPARIIIDRKGRCVDLRVDLRYGTTSTTIQLSGLSGSSRREPTTGVGQ